MSHKISIFIPVYRESSLLEPLLTGLLEDPYENKEILVVIDEPTQRSLDFSSKFSSKVRFMFNGERKGKANVLNEIVKESTGDVFLFLDSDVLLDVEKKGESFLEALAREIDNAEIVEVKKGVIKDSFISRIACYDYLSFNLTSWYFSRRIGRCLGINGAAFAIKRETFESLGGFRRVICEDLDIATRAFIKGASFKFMDRVTAYTRVPSSWREWFNQRKRWGIGAAFWFKDHFKLLKHVLKEHPDVAVPSLLFIFPALPLLLVNLFTPDDLPIKMLYVSLILLSSRTNLLIPPTALTSTTLSTLRSFLIVAGNLVAYSSIFYFIARKLRFPFNPVEFTVFYFLMAPLWLFIIVASLIKVYTKSKNINVDWKV